MLIFRPSKRVVEGHCGASGLGEATVRALAAKGVKVAIFDMNEAKGEAVAKEIGGVFCKVNVADEASVDAGFEKARAAIGQERVLVNCAGIGPSMRILGKKGVHDLAFYAKVVQVNLVGSFNVLALASEEIAKTDADEDGQRGVIINTASIAAYDGQVGQAAYSSSKGGIVGLTLPAARDLAQYGIRVCTIAPGIVETPMLATVSEEFRASLPAMEPARVTVTPTGVKGINTKAMRPPASDARFHGMNVMTIAPNQ